MKSLLVSLITVQVLAFSANAQLRISINIGTQPSWGPVGYDYVDYYYLPEADMYYYVPDKVFIYRNGNSWRRSVTLPSRYHNIDLYRTHKVVINGVNRPYLNNSRYQREYNSYRNRYDQTPIRDSRDEKYFQNRQHPQHDQWKRNNPGHGRRNDKGHQDHHGQRN